MNFSTLPRRNGGSGDVVVVRTQSHLSVFACPNMFSSELRTSVCSV
jgi:hypothetical protein